MQVESERQGAVTVLRPRGPLIAEDAEVVRHKGGEAIADSLGRLVIDASAIVYVDSKGIEALLDLADELSDAGQVLKLSGTNETMREALEITETAGMFEHFEDVQSAVRSFL
ncbi:MAG: STAS domain-containing protein [Planctomycetota bacterium]|nr:MAG: STAS domain-containing protein [Planctomycetota bacterium]